MGKNKHTLVLGASENPERYSYRAVKMLQAKGITVTAIGAKEGNIDGISIVTGFPKTEHVDTITLYLSAKNQQPYYNYILAQKPSRIIFNPGAENPELEQKATEAGIESINACTLVMLTTGTY